VTLSDQSPRYALTLTEVEQACKHRVLGSGRRSLFLFKSNSYRSCLSREERVKLAYNSPSKSESR